MNTFTITIQLLYSVRMHYITGSPLYKGKPHLNLITARTRNIIW